MPAIPAVQKLAHMHPLGQAAPAAVAASAVPEIDIAVEKASAYEQGLREGRLAVQHEFALKQDLLEATHQHQLRQLLDEHIPSLASGFDSGIVRMCDAICTNVTEVLRPVLARFVTSEMFEAINMELRAAIEDISAPAILVQGPEAIIERLKSEFAGRGANATFEVTQAVDVRLTIDQRIVETRLGAWSQLLGGGT